MICKLDKKFESLAMRKFKLNFMGTVSIAYGPRNNNWKYLDRVVWEMEYGKIPFGNVILHKDGDLLNCKLENLRLYERFTKIYYNICLDHDINSYVIHRGEILPSILPNGLGDLCRKQFRKFQDALEYFERYNEHHDFILTRDFDQEEIPGTVVPLDPSIRCVCGKMCRSPALKRTHDKRCGVGNYHKGIQDFIDFPKSIFLPLNK